MWVRVLPQTPSHHQVHWCHCLLIATRLIGIRVQTDRVRTPYCWPMLQHQGKTRLPLPNLCESDLSPLLHVCDGPDGVPRWRRVTRRVLSGAKDHGDFLKGGGGVKTFTSTHTHPWTLSAWRHPPSEKLNPPFLNIHKHTPPWTLPVWRHPHCKGGGGWSVPVTHTLQRFSVSGQVQGGGWSSLSHAHTHTHTHTRTHLHTHTHTDPPLQCTRFALVTSQSVTYILWRSVVTLCRVPSGPTFPTFSKFCPHFKKIPTFPTFLGKPSERWLRQHFD